MEHCHLLSNPKKNRQNITAMVYDKKGKLLSIGRNSYVKTHTLQAKAAAAVNKPGAIYLHAEVAAIAKLPDWSKAHRIHVIRFRKDGTPALAAPCPACMWVIKQTGIKVVEHT